ncbi:MAG: hypothetical protein ACQ9MH_04775 [Nitrospinales bacterium]
MNKIMAIIVIVALVVVVQNYMDKEEVMAPVKMPEKESTWVKTEKVRMTKDQGLTGVQQALGDIKVNADLKASLMNVKVGTSGSATETITDKKSCLKRLAPLDKKRTAVQKAGGVWHVFEARADTRVFSHNAMQIDSKTNKMIFALRHLCTTAKGIPLDGLATYISGEIEEKGFENTQKELYELEKAKPVVDVWLNYAEVAKKNEKRTVDYKEIDGLISRTEPLVDFYSTLSQRKIDDTTVKTFLSDAVTLLDVLDEFLTQDSHMVMALNEDDSIPAYEFEGEM